MDNIFNILSNKLPKPTAEQLQQLSGEGPATKPQDLNSMDNKSLVKYWQKHQDNDVTTLVLKRMQPTIRSAITSYAPGMDKQLSVQAAKLTLEALKAYDPDKGAEPGTFVFHNLKRLNRIGAQRSNIIPQSEARTLEQKSLRAVIDNFRDIYDRDPSDAELADRTGFSIKKINKLLDDTVVVSESSTLSEDSQRSTFTTGGGDDDDYFEYVYTSVGPIDQKIMEWTSGKHGKPMLSNNEIASKLKLSAAAISQRKQKLQKMLSDMRSLL